MKFSFCSNKNDQSIEKTVRHMVDAQKINDFQDTKVYRFNSNAAFATVQTNEVQSSVMLSHSDQNGNLIFLSGAPVCFSSDLNELLPKICASEFSEAQKLLKLLDGGFSGLYYDAAHQKVIFMTDILGVSPLYFKQDDQNLMVSTDVRAITAANQGNVEMDMVGWGAFVMAGFQIGQQTMVKGVVRAKPACIYTLDLNKNKMEEQVYWKWPPPKAEMPFRDIDTDDIVEVVTEHMRECLKLYKSPKLFLSGGIDSRFIGGILKNLGQKPECIIIGHSDERNNLDGRLAMRVANKLGFPYSVIYPDEGFFSTRKFLDYSIQSDMSTPHMNLFIANVAASIKPEFGAVWDGLIVGLPIMLNYYYANSFSELMRESLKIDDNPSIRAAEKMFSSSVVEQMKKEFRMALKKEKGRYPDDGFGVVEFIIRNRLRNRTSINPYQVFANNVLPFTPGMSRDFMNIIGSIAMEHRKNAKLIKLIYRRHFNDLTKIPICSGGDLFDFKRHNLGLQQFWINQREKLSNNYYIQKLTGKQKFRWAHSRLIDYVINNIDADHPEINADAVRLIRDWPQGHEHRLVYYWQIWRWLMEGQLESKMAGYFRGQ